MTAGEGIGYGYRWDPSSWYDRVAQRGISGHWDTRPGTPWSFGGDWDTSFWPSPDCHQSVAGYPHLVAATLNAKLTDLACTGSTGLVGVLEGKKGQVYRAEEPDKTRGQLGSDVFADLKAGSDPPNPAYDQARPDIVLMTVGANDIKFVDEVKRCYAGVDQLVVIPNVFTQCGTDQDRRDLQTHLVAQRTSLRNVLDEIHRRGEAAGKVPLVFVSGYHNPFPLTYPSLWSSCIDINPAAARLLDNGEMQYLEDGLDALNKSIEDVAHESSYKGFVTFVPASPNFRNHPWCSSDPWVYGPSIAYPWELSEVVTQEMGNKDSLAPFHPTAEGQRAFADQLTTYVNSVAYAGPVGRCEIDFKLDGKVTFPEVTTPGNAWLNPFGVPGSQRSRARGISRAAAVATPAGFPAPSTFTPVAFYSAGTSAEYTGGIDLSVPAQGATDLYVLDGGAWRHVLSRTDGTTLTAHVDRLAPFALGLPAPRVTAAFAVALDGATVPAKAGFDASGSQVEDDAALSYTWDFGDGGSGTGAHPAHGYAVSGTYRVTLTAASASGASDTVTHAVTFVNASPTANLEAPGTAVAGQAAAGFDGSGSRDPNGTVRELTWDFGDGTAPVTGARQTHTFADAGTYVVTLAASDDEGMTSTTSATVAVSAPRASPNPPNPATPPSPVAPRPTALTAQGRLGSRVSVDARGRLHVTGSCVKPGLPCTGKFAVATRKGRGYRTAASKRVSLAPGTTRTYALPLPAPLRRALRAHRVRLRVTFTLTDGSTATISPLVRAGRRA